MKYFHFSDHYESCYQVYTSGKSLPGNYYLKLDNGLVEVHCLEQGWIVFQSRGQFGNPSDYFSRGWDDYVKGFGTPGKYIIYLCSINIIFNQDLGFFPLKILLTWINIIFIRPRALAWSRKYIWTDQQWYHYGTEGIFGEIWWFYSYCILRQFLP